MNRFSPKELEGAVHTRIQYDKKKQRWVVSINDQKGLVQEYHCIEEPYMMVLIADKYGDITVMKTYPSDEVAKYKRGF